PGTHRHRIAMPLPLHAEYPSIAALSDALRARKVSALELADSALQAAQQSRHLNVFLHQDPDLTRAQAQAADERLARGDAGTLTGIPIAHKDVFVTRGWRTPAASRMLQNYVSP